MKKLITAFIILLISLILFSCNKKTEEMPDLSVSEPTKFIFSDAKLSEDEFSVTISALLDIDYKSIVITAGSEKQTKENGSINKAETISFKFNGSNTLGKEFKVTCSCDGEEISYEYIDLLPQLSISNVNIVANELTSEEIADLIILWQDYRAQNLCGSTFAIDRLGIPATYFADGTQGLRTNTNNVAYPQISVLASTWNEELVSKVAYSEGLICRDFGIDILLSPGINIKKNAQNGRNFEYASEDPLLSGYIGAAYVNGLQKTGVGASVKHYLANNQETCRDRVSSEVSERALREIYARSFEYLLKYSDPTSIMTSYNRVNGTYMIENKDLVDTVLRGEFGYSGLVLSDWHANGNRLKLLSSGMSIYCGAYVDEYKNFVNSISKRIESGKEIKEDIDEQINIILTYIAKSNTMNGVSAQNQMTDLEKRLEVAKEGAEEGIVLLKNDGALPIKSGKIAICGTEDIYIGGKGSSEVVPYHTVNFSEGLTNAGFTCESFLNASDINANSFDAAIYIISRSSTEGADMEEKLFNLTKYESNNLKTISEAFRALGKKVIVVINSGNPIETASWIELCDGLFYVGYCGEQLGNAFASVFSGSVNPSGKLTETWPKTLETTPAYSTFPGTEQKVEYNEDIYVGYRYYETFGIDVSFEFGYGLSYTEFEYSDFNITEKDSGYELSVKIKNVGKTAGKEIAEFYVSIPDGENEHPAFELCGYAKTSLLKKGKSETVKIFIDKDVLKTYKTGEWFIENGEYKFSVGASVKNIKTEKVINISGGTYKTVTAIEGADIEIISKEQ